MSLRRLQELFQEREHCVSEWIWERRLDSAAKRLRDPACTHVPIGTLAYDCGFSNQAHFSRRFRATYGETPYAYLMSRRIERAKQLLRRGDLSVTEVCVTVGCASLGSFSARFTQVVGMTPTAYRMRDHSALAGTPGCIARDLTRPARKASRIGEATFTSAP